MNTRSPPAIWSILLTIITALWVLDDYSRQIAPAAAMFFLPPVIGVILLGDYIFHIARSSRQPSAIWRWFVFPLALLLVLSSLQTHWPMKLRFGLSQTAFEQKVKSVLDNSNTEFGVQRIGLYQVRRIVDMENGKVGFVTGSSIIDPVAITYDPSNPKSTRYNMQIRTNWYAQEW